MRSYYKPKESSDPWQQHVLNALRPLKKGHIGRSDAEKRLPETEVALHEQEQLLQRLISGSEVDSARARFAAKLITMWFQDRSATNSGKAVQTLTCLRAIMPGLPVVGPYIWYVPSAFENDDYFVAVRTQIEQRIEEASKTFSSLKAKFESTPRLIRAIILIGAEAELKALQSEIRQLNGVLENRKQLGWAFAVHADRNWTTIWSLEVAIECSKLTIRKCRTALGLSTRSKPSGSIVRARVAAMDKRSRDLAARHRDYLPKPDRCPYCQAEVDQGDYHLDHIYPVKMGGLSIPENLVWVCRDCNSKKSDRGLLDYLLSRNFEVGPIITRLRSAGKHI